ncbi:sensor histidine kinase [Halobellus captivus]|uniref:sensor histidine kinase n=1 Tax=Halobellus captivus TaxID=2592614 RepID=UPI0011A371F8|nr:HAMP domain-containing sensor histidine kinase [Halobellus captivus]
MNPVERLHLGGLVVAVSSFGITRIFVAQTLRVDAALPFVVAGLLPLVVGLALTLYGVALAVGPFSHEYVVTVARWHLLGVTAMAVVFVLTSLDQYLRTGLVTVGVDAPLLVANVLLGGAVGGTLTGMQSGKTLRQQREIRSAANRALLVNRLLKHEVLNAITIIDGHADLLRQTSGTRSESLAAIRRAVQRIRSTIGEVGTIARDGDRGKRIDLERVLRAEIERVQSESEVEIRIDNRTEDASVAADSRIELVVRELLKNAAMYGQRTDVSVVLRERQHAIELSVADDGSGLPAPQRALLEEGSFPEFDDPTAGFGLQMVRLLVVRFGGTIGVGTPQGEETGTQITVTLPRSDREAMDVESVGLSFPNLGQAVLGGVLGGIAMGGFYQSSTGLLPVIGSLYGIQSPLIGWVTHLFHSAIFGLLFAAATTSPRLHDLASGAIRCGVLGLVWGSVLWFVAAGVIMPVWLTLVGIPTSIPQLSVVGLVGHLV